MASLGYGGGLEDFAMDTPDSEMVVYEMTIIIINASEI